ncbi:hypothetical protein CTA1_12675 [Colletotrichum tanaceti]|uniref:Uncharacterized protein n=1 Tax=Colletotrichum tanaceti TaxID=1306861 RepID=A0A4U6X3F5_9PEZI|nr:hypothetical protein CTA1_12675 [Colletotrichum tanaceti]
MHPANEANRASLFNFWLLGIRISLLNGIVERDAVQRDGLGLLDELPDEERQRDERDIPARQPGKVDSLLPHGLLEADVVEQDGGPRHQHAGGGQVDEPPEDGQRAVGQAHEAEGHEAGEEQDADVGGAPGGGAEEDPGGLALEGEAEQHAGAGEQALVGGGPGGGDDDGVDDAGDGGDAGGGGGDDEGALGGGAVGVVEARVVAGDEHADDEDGEHVEEDDAGEDALAGARDGAARVPGLGGGHGEGLDAGEGEDGARHDAPVAEELAPVAGGDVLDKGTRAAPVAEADARGAGDAAEVDDEAEDDEEDDEQDLEQGEEELDLAEDADEGDADDKGQDDEDDDEDGGVQVGPELEEDADGGDLGGDGEDVAVDEVPADGEAPGRVDEELGVADEGAGDGQQGRDLAEGELDGADDEADGGVAEQGAEGAAGLDGAAEAEEEAGADGAGDAQHGQVALLEAALQVAVLGGGDEVGVVIVVRLKGPAPGRLVGAGGLDVIRGDPGVAGDIGDAGRLGAGE